jgi:hypothetical protein
MYDVPLGAESSSNCEHSGPGSCPGRRHVGFVVDKAALGQVFSQYFDLPC